MISKALGITLPITRGNNGYFGTTTDVATQLRSNLTNLLLTKKGERMMQPLFGCTVHSLLFEAQTDNTMSEIKASINAAVAEWMPFIGVDSIEIAQHKDENKVFVKIAFKLLTNSGITDSIVLVY